MTTPARTVEIDAETSAGDERTQTIPEHQSIEIQLKYSVDQYRIDGDVDFLFDLQFWDQQQDEVVARGIVPPGYRYWPSQPRAENYFDPNGFRVRAIYAVTFDWKSNVDPGEKLVSLARDKARILIWPYLRQLMLSLSEMLGMIRVDVGLSFGPGQAGADYSSPALNVLNHLYDRSSADSAPPEVRRVEPKGHRS